MGEQNKSLQQIQREWKASTQIICDGKIMKGTPKDKWIFAITIFCYLFVIIYFNSLISQQIWAEIHPVFVFLMFIISSFGGYHLITCRYTDAGVLIRGDLEMPENLKQQEKQEREKYLQYQVYDIKNQQQSIPQQNQLQQKNTTQESELQNKQNHQMMDDSINNNNNIIDINNQNTNFKINNTNNKNNNFSIKTNNSDENKLIEQYPIQNNNNKIQHLEEEKQQKLLQKENKEEVTLKIWTERYCKTCKIMKPPKTSHCGHCDQCVTHYDHHCYVVGNCIGERNFVNFLLMQLSFSLYIGFALILISIVLNTQMNNFPNFFSEYFENQDFYFYSFIILCGFFLIFILIRYHNEVILTNILFIIIIFIIKSSSITNEQNLKILQNPAYSIIGIFIFICAGLYLVPITLLNIYNASNGFTLKERSEIEKQANSSQYYNISCGKRIKNLCKVICQKPRKSYILK